MRHLMTMLLALASLFWSLKEVIPPIRQVKGYITESVYLDNQVFVSEHCRYFVFLCHRRIGDSSLNLA